MWPLLFSFCSWAVLLCLSLESWCLHSSFQGFFLKVFWSSLCLADTRLLGACLPLPSWENGNFIFFLVSVWISWYISIGKWRRRLDVQNKFEWLCCCRGNGYKTYKSLLRFREIFDQKPHCSFLSSWQFIWRSILMCHERYKVLYLYVSSHFQSCSLCAIQPYVLFHFFSSCFVSSSWFAKTCLMFVRPCYSVSNNRFPGGTTRLIYPNFMCAKW